MYLTSTQSGKTASVQPTDFCFLSLYFLFSMNQYESSRFFTFKGNECLPMLASTKIDLATRAVDQSYTTCKSLHKPNKMVVRVEVVKASLDLTGKILILIKED